MIEILKYKRRCLKGMKNRSLKYHKELGFMFILFGPYEVVDKTKHILLKRLVFFPNY